MTKSRKRSYTRRSRKSSASKRSYKRRSRKSSASKRSYKRRSRKSSASKRNYTRRSRKSSASKRNYTRRSSASKRSYTRRSRKSDVSKRSYSRRSRKSVSRKSNVLAIPDIVKKVEVQRRKDAKKKSLKKFDVDEIIFDRTPHVDDRTMDLIRQFTGEKELKMIEQESDYENEIRVFKDRFKKNKKFKMNLFKNGINFIPGIKIITKKIWEKCQISSDAAIVLNDIMNTIFNKFIKNRYYPDNMEKALIDIMKNKDSDYPSEILKHSISETRKLLKQINEDNRRNISDKEKYENTELVLPFLQINNIVQDLHRTVYICAFLEYIAAEIIYLSGELTINENRKRITVEDIIMQSIFGVYQIFNDELSTFIKKVGYRFEFL